MVKVLAERGSVEPDKVKKLLGDRGSQLSLIVTILAEDELEESRLHPIKVSQRDIRLGLSRLKDAPGIHSVEVEKRRAAEIEE